MGGFTEEEFSSIKATDLRDSSEDQEHSAGTLFVSYKFDENALSMFAVTFDTSVRRGDKKSIQVKLC